MSKLNLAILAIAVTIGFGSIQAVIAKAPAAPAVRVVSMDDPPPVCQILPQGCPPVNNDSTF